VDEVRIDSLEWDNYREEHVARHNVEPEEVWEICRDALHLAHVEETAGIEYMDKLMMDVTCSRFSNESEEQPSSQLLPVI